MTAAAILLVEDNPDDLELTRIALDDARLAHPLVVARDGVEALDYLFARGVHAGRDPRALPALVLLDLHLPRLDGDAVVAAIRAEPATRTLPVVALAGDPAAAVDGALAVDGYLPKPVECTRFEQVTAALGLAWQRRPPDAR